MGRRQAQRGRLFPSWIALFALTVDSHVGGTADIELVWLLRLEVKIATEVADPCPQRKFYR
jgi:hypothetical protein